MSDEEASFQLRMSDSDAASCEEGSGAMFGLTSKDVLSLPQEMQSVLQSTQETLNQRKRRRQDEQEAFEKRVRGRQERQSAAKHGWDFKLREVALLAVQVPEGPPELRKILQNEAQPEVAWTVAGSKMSKDVPVRVACHAFKCPGRTETCAAVFGLQEMPHSISNVIT
ncbi:unnamed protein product [Symbiodinium sp. CCMP2592]|nr:unnamed protein product [Symbiodinium sp. CCMP2592]